MKIFRIFYCFAVLFFIPTHPVQHNHEVIGRSFMFTRPAYYNLAMYQQLAHTVMLNKRGNFLGGLHFIAFYQQSVSLDKTIRYFLIKCKTELLVSGDTNVGDAHTRDIRAEWLGLPSNFRGFLTIKPKQRQAGFLVEYHQDLSRFFDYEFFNNSWVSVVIPLVAVQNDFNLCQFDLKNTANSFPHDIIEAFRQKKWLFGKIRGKKTRFAPAEIKASLGRTYHAQDNFEVDYYGSFIIPTAKKPDPEFIFDPVVGNCRHVGLGGGVHLQFVLNRPSTLDWCFYLDLEGIFLVRNHQCRTYDLKNRPWSRFLLYNIKNGPPNQNIPGVNVLTLDTIVRSYGMFDFSTGFRLKANQWTFELGYSCWGHDQEKLELHVPFVNPCNPEFGIAGVGALNPTAPVDQQIATSASTSTISTLAANDLSSTGTATFVSITDNDIDFTSAASSSALNHMAHCAFGYESYFPQVTTFVGFGIFADFVQKNGSLMNWGAWTKLGCTF